MSDELRDLFKTPIDVLGQGSVEVPADEIPGPDWVPAEERGEPRTIFGMPVVWVEPEDQRYSK